MNNRFLGEKFAKDFNKKYGIITYSGTLAIEIALSNLKRKAKVLVLSEVCYSIVNTILKLDLIPVIVNPKESWYFTNDDIDEILTKETIDCILLVHQYGILNNLDLKKYKDKKITIIEDVSQAWKISKNIVGKYSDIVITSFGKTKPLSYGIGGGLFFNNKMLFEKIDYDDKDSRNNENILFSYAYPLCENIPYNKLKKIANQIVKEQRKNAMKYANLIKEYPFIKGIKYSNSHVWHRYPIWVEDYQLYQKLVTKLKKSKLEYQLRHDIDLINLKRNKDCVYYNYEKQKKYVILLRTRNILIDKQLKILNEILDNIV